MHAKKKIQSAQSLQLHHGYTDVFGMRSYQKMVSDVTVFSPGKNQEDVLVEAVKKLRAFEKEGLATQPDEKK